MYVARPGLDPEVLRTLRENLVAIQSENDKELLGQLSHNTAIQGFDAVRDEDFNDTRAAMNQEITLFENAARTNPKEANAAR